MAWMIEYEVTFALSSTMAAPATRRLSEAVLGFSRSVSSTVFGVVL
jgi:hypothetical protein